MREMGDTPELHSIHDHACWGKSKQFKKGPALTKRGVHHLHTGLRVTALSDHDPTASPQGAVSPQTGPFTGDGATSPSNLYFLLRNYNSSDSPYLYASGRSRSCLRTRLCQRALLLGNQQAQNTFASPAQCFATGRSTVARLLSYQKEWRISDSCCSMRWNSARAGTSFCFGVSGLLLK